MSHSLILEEDYDENYEPTEQEIVEYAIFLGMDPILDKEFFWIARESLKAPLPSNWKPCQTEDGNIYYFNFTSGESIWDHPCDEHYKDLFQREKKKKLQSKNSVVKQKENVLSDGQSLKSVGLLSVAPKKSGKEILAPIKQPHQGILAPLTPLLNLKTPEANSTRPITLLEIKNIPKDIHSQESGDSEKKIADNEINPSIFQEKETSSPKTDVPSTIQRDSVKQFEQDSIAELQERKKLHEIQLLNLQQQFALQLEESSAIHSRKLDEIQEKQALEMDSISKRFAKDLLEFKAEQEKKLELEKSQLVKRLQASMDRELQDKQEEFGRLIEGKLQSMTKDFAVRLKKMETQESISMELKLDKVKQDLESKFSAQQRELEVSFAQKYQECVQQMEKTLETKLQSTSNTSLMENKLIELSKTNPHKSVENDPIEEKGTQKKDSSFEFNWKEQLDLKEPALEESILLPEDDLLLQLQKRIHQDNEFLNAAKDYLSSTSTTDPVVLALNTSDSLHLPSQNREECISFIESNYSKTWHYLKDHKEKLIPSVNYPSFQRNKDYIAQNARFQSLCKENSVYLEKLKI